MSLQNLGVADYGTQPYVKFYHIFPSGKSKKIAARRSQHRERRTVPGSSYGSAQKSKASRGGGSARKGATSAGVGFVEMVEATVADKRRWRATVG